MMSDDDAGALENAWEAGFLYQNQVDGLTLSLGGGYSRLSTEADDPAPAALGSETQNVFNVGATVTRGKWAGGAAYLRDDHGIAGDGATDIKVLGLSYDISQRTVLGASRYDREDEGDFSATGESDLVRHSLGLRHKVAPGLVYAGSIHRIDLENDLGDGQGTEISLGAQLHF